MSLEHIVVGLELGTTKICAAVGERLRTGDISLIGLGESESRGIRKGEVVNREQAEACIRRAVERAEESAHVEIRSVTLAITGGHIRSFNNTGSVPVTGVNGEISPEDVEAALRNARAISLPAQNDLLNSLQRHFCVDGQDEVLDPIGITGARLQVDLHILHGIRTRLQNSILCVQSVGLEVDDLIFSALASATSVLTERDREMGALLIDLGGGTTEFAVYTHGAILHSGVLAVGGDHFTNDVSLGLKIPLSLAERLKREHGSVRSEDAAQKQMIPVLDTDAFVGRHELPRHTLCRVLQLRAEEILSLIKREVQTHCSLDYLGAGVFLCGGTAQMKGLPALAEQVFGLPVRIGFGRNIGGIAAALQKPQYTAAVGALQHALQTQPPPRPLVAPLAAFSSRIGSFFLRARNVLMA